MAWPSRSRPTSTSACLVAAGAADMISGIFRETLWNQTIPDEFRGRLAGVELLSYGIGPPAGQLRSGVVASLAGTEGLARLRWIALRGRGGGGRRAAAGVHPVREREKEGAQRRRVPPGTGPMGS